LAERYGKSMINDFNNGRLAWTDWNILLDETGDPNYVGNLCFSPVHGNTQTGELTLTNTYYYIGHFSKFIRPEAKRITAFSSFNTLLSTAFVNTDGSLVVVIINQGETELDFSLSIASNTAHLSALAHSIQTIVLK